MLEVAKDDSVSLSKLDVYSIYSPQITEVDLFKKKGLVYYNKWLGLTLNQPCILSVG